MKIVWQLVGGQQNGKVARSVVVMADGEKVAAGTPDEIRNNPLVHAIYLGQEGAA